MAEVAGLVLGAIPIVIGALKQYESLYRACRKFRKCKCGVEELLHCLQTQKIIFKNETELLLSNAIGSEIARSLVNDLDHPLWSDETTADRVDSTLGDSKDAITKAGCLLSRKLKSFEDALESFQSDDSSTQQSQSKAWKKEVRRRFKYVFSEDKLLSTAETIVSLTENYRTLRMQLDELQISKPEPQTNYQQVQANLKRVADTQSAARRVYEVLAAACTLHSKHHAHLSLRPRYNSSTKGTEIKFQIAFRHLSRQQAKSSNDVLWFMVESVLEGTISIPRSMSMNSPATSGKRPRSPSLVSMHGTLSTQAKRVRFQSPPPMPKDSDSATCIVPLLDSSLLDLGSKPGFCTQFRACCKKTHAPGSCIGALADSSQRKHLVYHSNGPMEHSLSNKAETLADLLESISKSKDATQGLPVVQRLQLAKLITNATLNYHNTPWMQSCWDSSDIFLYDFDQLGTSAVSTEPDAFVEVPVAQQLSQKPSAGFHSVAPFVRNPNLFNVAVMLLELAYEKPLKEMIETSDVKPGQPASTIAYFAAVRLSRAVATKLGPRYSQLIEQCLYCDFGHGSDLSSPALQSAIQRDIVSELDRLADGLQKLLIV